MSRPSNESRGANSSSPGAIATGFPAASNALRSEYAASKRGDRYLRMLLVHGARARLRFVDRKTDPKSAWARRLKERRHVNVAAVALAAKHARIMWALLAKGTSYCSPPASTTAA
jgi:transposase